jgi:sterol desaturase/sphingolipid hydroxylase (fatty acid hydroxylase superfamily)
VKTLIGTGVAFLVLLGIFRLLELTRPTHKRTSTLRDGFLTDLAYWILTPFTTRVLTRTAVIITLVPIVWFAHGQFDPELVKNGFGPLSHLPLWVQAALIIVLSDFLSYWLHRGFHSGRLWRFHAVHHSPTTLDWMSAVRVHPVNDAVMRVGSAVPLVALGLAPVAVAGVVPFLTFMAIFIHANLDWDWGPLRGVIASPRFHRWHHTSEEEGRDKNFAGIFPLWDILFGTYHMPIGRVPQQFGCDLPVPQSLWGQWLFPFRRG